MGYELVSYLLHYTSMRCVTLRHKIFRKSGFICWDIIAQKNFERTCSDYRVRVCIR